MEKGASRTFPGQLEGQRELNPHTASPALPRFGNPCLGTEGLSLLWVWGFRVLLSSGKDLPATLGLSPAPGHGLSPEREQGHPRTPWRAGASSEPGRCGIFVLWLLPALLFPVIPCNSLLFPVFPLFLDVP